MPQTSEPLGWVKFWKPTDAWYYASKEERGRYLAQQAEIMAQAEATGARRVGSYKCRGQSSWPRFEVWEFPNLETLVQMTERLESIGHYLYFAESNTVGRRYTSAPAPESWVLEV